MGDAAKIALIIISIIVLILAIDIFGIFWESKIGVWRADVKREVFMKSRSYTQGMSQDLLRYMNEWQSADSTGRKSIEFTVRQMFSDYDENALPSEMSNFVKKCKYGENKQ